MKNKIVKTLMALTIVASVAGGANSMTAHAADYYGAFDGQAVKMISQVFDAEYYAETYPDVAAALGTDEATLLYHYLTCGIYEGRDASATFNADAYASANADLVAAYDTENDVADYCNYFLHYISCGQTEGRIATVADATAAGYTVTSVADETKTIATANTTKTYASSGSSSSGSSSSSSSSYSSSSSSLSSSSSSTDATITTDTTSTSASSTDTSSSSDSFTMTYNETTGEWDEGSQDYYVETTPEGEVITEE